MNTSVSLKIKELFDAIIKRLLERNMRVRLMRSFLASTHSLAEENDVQFFVISDFVNLRAKQILEGDMSFSCAISETKNRIMKVKRNDSF